jgi:hypothetical protein
MCSKKLTPMIRLKYSHWVFLVLLLAGAKLRAQMPIWVGLNNVNPFAVSQWKDEWCWAASSQLILNLYGIPITQADIVHSIHGNFDDYGGSDSDISASLNGRAQTPSGVRQIHSIEGSGLPAPAILIDQLRTGHPILIAYQSGPYSGHAVVVTAAAYFPSPQGPIVTSLVTRDPWPSPDHVASIGRVQYDGLNLSMFAATVRAHWLVWWTA